MEIVSLPGAYIYPHNDARPISQARVKEIAESIAEIGLLSPIIVRKARKIRNGAKADAYEILAGHHRFDAMFRHLKWEMIPCQVSDLDDLRAELVTIDENLKREQPSKALFEYYVHRRKEIYEALHPETAHEAFKGNQHTSGSRQFGDKQPERFTTVTAKATGQSERNIQRAAQRGEALGPDLIDIAGTSLDKGVELDALLEMEPAERRPLIERAKAGEKVSARKETIAASPLPDPEAVEKQFVRLRGAVSAAPLEVQIRLRDWLNDQVLTREPEAMEHGLS